MRNTMDLIIDRFWEELLPTGRYAEIKAYLDDEECWKLEAYPDRKLLESIMNGFFYSNLSRSFCNFDPSVFSLDFGPISFKNEIPREEFEQFCKKLFSEIRPLFLDHYESCYKKHPHPRIAKEIELLTAEIECDLPNENGSEYQNTFFQMEKQNVPTRSFKRFSKYFSPFSYRRVACNQHAPSLIASGDRLKK